LSGREYQFVVNGALVGKEQEEHTMVDKFQSGLVLRPVRHDQFVAMIAIIFVQTAPVEKKEPEKPKEPEKKLPEKKTMDVLIEGPYIFLSCF